MMKHIFIINPAAGWENSYEAIKEKLEALHLDETVSFYQTQAPGDATAYIREYCRKNPDEQVRFYACGGDGTLNEVVNGVVGFENASVGCYPCGSGNDFVKYYGGMRVFTDLEKLIHAPNQTIDLMRIGNKYAINVINFGFDSVVAKTMMSVRRKKLIGGKNAYTTGIVVALTKAMKNPCRVYVDGKLLNTNGKILLCTVSNGQYVGGSFRCAPRSRNNDGFLEVCLVTPVSRLTFLSLMPDYTNGTHLDNPKFDKYVEYCRAKSVRVEAPKGFICTVDGELVEQNEFTIEIAPAAISFAVPEGFSPNPGDLNFRPQTAEKSEEPAVV